MKVNRILEFNKHYEHRESIEIKPKKENSNNEKVSFLEILKENISKKRI